MSDTEQTMTNKEVIEYLGKIPIPRLMSNTLDDCIEQNKYCLAIHSAIEKLENIKAMGDELMEFRKGITDEQALIGFNMAIAICNKYLGDGE